MKDSEKTTTTAGAPVARDRNPIPAGPRGPKGRTSKYPGFRFRGISPVRCTDPTLKGKEIGDE